MLSCNKAEQYVQQVCEQIRWKKARAVVKKELLDHIEDQQEAYEAAGAAVEEAEIMAVEEMGSPLETGGRFDRLYRPRVEWNVLLFVGLLLTLGVVLRVSILSALGEAFHPVQDLWGLPVGLAMMVLAYWLDYTMLLSGGIKTAVAGMALAALFSFYLRGPEINGAYPTITYLALFWPLIFCSFVYAQRGRRASGLLYCFLFLFLSLYFFGSAQFIGSLLLIGVGTVVLFFALWNKWLGCSRWWGFTFLLFPAAVLTFILAKPYRMQRIYTIFDPFSDPLGAGYVSSKVMIAVQGASWIGPSSANLAIGTIPSLSTDYLLTATLNRFGWIAVIAILLVYALFLLACFFACRNIKNMLGKMVAVAIFTAWSIQLFFFVCNNFTAIQLGGYPLLFVQGNISMICNLFLLGVLLSVYKTGIVYQDAVNKQSGSLSKRCISFAHTAGKYLLSIQKETNNAEENHRN